MTKRVDLEDQSDLHALDFAELRQTIEDRFPVLIPSEIVVGHKEPVDALGGIRANDGLDLIGCAGAGFAALDVDDGAEAALKRTTSAGIERRIGAYNAVGVFFGRSGIGAPSRVGKSARKL